MNTTLARECLDTAGRLLAMHSTVTAAVECAIARGDLASAHEGLAIAAGLRHRATILRLEATLALS
jgi:hypothetical protein